MDALFGSKTDNSAAELAAKQQAENNRKSLAQMAASQAESDQAASNPGGGRKQGSKLLTFLSGNGQSTLG